MNRLAVALAALLAVAVGPVHAESNDDLRARIAALEQQLAEVRRMLADPARGGDPARVAELERRIDVLAEEIQTLRAESAPGGTAEARVPAGVAPGASKVYRSTGGVSIGGYGEALYQDFSSTRDDGIASDEDDQADMLRLVLYFGYKFTDRIVFNSEVEFEHGSTGEGGEVSVEFAHLDFILDPLINARAGLVLVPVGLVNELHEPPVFLGARRPEVETNVLPSTWRELGAGIFGDVGPFSYRAYFLTGLDGSGFTAESGIRGGRQDGAKALANDFAVVVRADLTGVPGLLAGASWYRGKSGQGKEVSSEEMTRTMPDARVTSLDLHADWKWRGLLLRGLWARVDVEDVEQIHEVTGESVGSRIEGWYGEAGFDVLAATRWNRRALIPFARIEQYDTQAALPASLAAGRDLANDRELRTYGVVFKPIPQVAIKVDWQDIDDAAGTGVDQFNAAIGFYF